MNPEDLLSTDRFTKPQTPRPKGAGGPKKFGGQAGGRPFQKGGFNKGGGNFNRPQGQGRPPFNKGQGNFRR